MKMIKDLGLSYARENSLWKCHYGLFECPYCGKHFRVNMSSIQSGNTKSCGCSTMELRSIRLTKHGMCESRIYKILKQMKQRCYNKNYKQFKDYGEKGVVVCDEWLNDFLAFKNWAFANGYADKLLIDRINTGGIYEPSNCRWLTKTESNQNTGLLRSTNTSGYRGVCWDKRHNKWKSLINYNGKAYSLGSYSTAELAAKAYNDFVIKHHSLHPLNPV